MKKSIRAVLLVFLSMVLIFASVTSVWGWSSFTPTDEFFDGLPYPVPNELKENVSFARDWYDFAYKKGERVIVDRIEGVKCLVRKA